MAEARQHDGWNYVSAIMAHLANIHRDPKKGRALKPRDFHPMLNPMTASARQPLPRSDLSVLKAVFVDAR